MKSKIEQVGILRNMLAVIAVDLVSGDIRRDQILAILEETRPPRKPKTYNAVADVLQSLQGEGLSNIESTANKIVTEYGLYGNDGPKRAWTEAVLIELTKRGII